MLNNDIRERLNALGLYSLQAREIESASRTLADIVISRNSQLWELFPVVLANIAERALFDYQQIRALLAVPAGQDDFAALVAMSLTVYDLCNLQFAWTGRLQAILQENQNEQSRVYLNNRTDDALLQVSGLAIPLRRLLVLFKEYYLQTAERTAQARQIQDEPALHSVLSFVFSQKQKELFLKKVKREALTKTEKEYYSRTVKKTVMALANPDLYYLTHHNYLTQPLVSPAQALPVRDARSFEAALSLMFSPKQKELFLKKVKNVPMTKTEKEYFSRTVKKITLALADPQLHQLAQGLME